MGLDLNNPAIAAVFASFCTGVMQLIANIFTDYIRRKRLVRDLATIVHDYLSEDDIEDIIREGFYVDEFDFNEKNAYECDLIPFSIYCADEDKDIYLLALGGCGMDLRPKLDAYFFLQTGKMDQASKYFSDKEYFKSLVPIKIFKAINEKFGGVV